jgi:hypothetical protein
VTTPEHPTPEWCPCGAAHYTKDPCPYGRKLGAAALVRKAKRLDFMAMSPPAFDPNYHTELDVLRAARECFVGVAPDLGVESTRDSAFQDYIGDHMSDAGVPPIIIERVRAALKQRG